MVVLRSTATTLAAAALAAVISMSAVAQGQEIALQTDASAVAVTGQLPDPIAAEIVPPAASASAIPAGTFIVIQLDGPVTPRTATRSDMFPISLAESISIEGVEVVPAGIVGEGQVIHSAGTGFGGRAGELIVAARYLMWGDRRIALRGMRISAAGRNNTAEAIAASAVLTVAGLFVTGTSVDLPAGQIAIARLAEDVPKGVAGASVGAQPTTTADSTTVATEDGTTPASSDSSAVEKGEIE